MTADALVDRGPDRTCPRSTARVSQADERNRHQGQELKADRHAAHDDEAEGKARFIAQARAALEFSQSEGHGDKVGPVEPEAGVTKLTGPRTCASDQTNEHDDRSAEDRRPVRQEQEISQLRFHGAQGPFDSGISSGRNLPHGVCRPRSHVLVRSNGTDTPFRVRIPPGCGLCHSLPEFRGGPERQNPRR